MATLGRPLGSLGASFFSPVAGSAAGSVSTEGRGPSCSCSRRCSFELATALLATLDATSCCCFGSVSVSVPVLSEPACSSRPVLFLSLLLLHQRALDGARPRASVESVEAPGCSDWALFSQSVWLDQSGPCQSRGSILPFCRLSRVPWHAGLPAEKCEAELTRRPAVQRAQALERRGYPHSSATATMQNPELHGSCVLGSKTIRCSIHSYSCTPFRWTTQVVSQKGLRSCTVDMSISTTRLLTLKVRFYP